MEKVFDMHCHYLFKLSLKETAEILEEEFEITDTETACFLSIPQEYDFDGVKRTDLLQNIKGMYLKKHFAPNGYCFAGLVHPDDYSNKEKVANELLSQVMHYYNVGFDGIKLLEGYPTFIKYTKQNIDSDIYDKFFRFCEEKQFPITIHIANPDENWDIKNASKEAIEQKRVYDGSFPSKADITNALFNVLKKYPNLKISVAHFGFFSEHYEDAIKYMSYPNTLIDITPGGEQLINMSKNWEIWLKFFEKYQDRIIYGSDFYAFPKDENWMVCFNRRPKFIREFFETDTEHLYLENPFRGVKLDKSILKKIYRLNAENLLGMPKPMRKDYFIKEINRLKKCELTDFELNDLEYIRKNTN